MLISSIGITFGLVFLALSIGTVALIIILFVLVAEILEGLTVERGRRAIRDLLELLPRTVIVRGLSESRGPAPVAQALYEETPDSIALRERMAQARREGAEPAQSIEQGRPTKRDRRELAEWNRWSASAEPE